MAQRELDWFALTGVLLRGWVLLLLGMLAGGALMAWLAWRMDPVYRAEAILAAVDDEPANSGFASLAGQLGGLANVAGISLGGDTSKDEIVAYLKSRRFAEDFIASKQLGPILYAKRWDAERGAWRQDDPDYEPPTPNEIYTKFNRMRMVSQDKRTGLITLAVEWTDPEQSAAWVNAMVDMVNRQLQAQAIKRAGDSVAYLNRELDKTRVVELQQSIYRLIEAQIKQTMLANVRDDYALKLIDPAVAPDEDQFVKPRRGLLVAVGVIAGLLFAAFLLVLRNFLRQGRD